MGIGDAPLPVTSDAPINNPVPVSGTDAVDSLETRVKKLERVTSSEIIEQIRHLYDLLSEPYPP